MSMDESEAQAALAAARESRTRLALAQARWPWSRHALFAALLGGLAAAQALRAPFNVVADAGLAFAAAGVAAMDRRRNGVFVNGWRRGRTLWVTLLVVAVAVGLGLLGLWLSRTRGLVFAPAAIGLALFPIGLVASKTWEGIYRRELQEKL